MLYLVLQNKLVLSAWSITAVSSAS
jgi:hypothetical protein